MTFYKTEIIEAYKAELLKPFHEDLIHIEVFNPWMPLKGFLYGSYSQEFDLVAITVLQNMRDRNYDGEEAIAHEMFREILCVADLCGYGTSPRVCFPVNGFEDILHELIEKWIHFSFLSWGNKI